ncbi:MAG: hypothetical protein P8N76_19440 [Pirellulaceae bacterium]|nr:hypothetical protein [Pirellulaceae bacterium]
MQRVLRAASRAELIAGNNKTIKIPIRLITTSSSMNVNAGDGLLRQSKVMDPVNDQFQCP